MDLGEEMPLHVTIASYWREDM